MFCANYVVVKTGCFRQIAGMVLERLVFFVARPSVKALGSNPTAVTLRQVGQAPIERHTKRMATCPICLYQQNIAGVEPPIFVEEVPAPFHKVRKKLPLQRPSFVWENVAPDAVRWQNHGVLRSTCGPPWDHTCFPKIMTRWDENVICSLWCIAYACYWLPFLECNRSNIENNNTNEKDTINEVFGWQRIGNMWCRVEFPLHCTSALNLPALWHAGCDAQNYG